MILICFPLFQSHVAIEYASITNSFAPFGFADYFK